MAATILERLENERVVHFLVQQKEEMIKIIGGRDTGIGYDMDYWQMGILIDELNELRDKIRPSNDPWADSDMFSTGGD